MPIQPNQPNRESDVHQFSEKVEKVVENSFLGLGKTLTVKDVLGVSFLEKRTGKTTSEAVLLNELINNLDTPMLKGLVQDTIAVVSNWFESPEILCCLIQGLWAMYAASNGGTLAQIQKNGIGLADSNFGRWIDVIIATVDFIIVFLGSDVKKISIMIPDLIKEITNGVIGAILMVLQEVLFALRDSVLNQILAAIDKSEQGGLDSNNIWAKCIPFSQLIEVLKRYIHDYGLFAQLFEKIKGYVSTLVGKFEFYKKLDFPKNVRDLEFLYWFRDLLVKLKEASINFDLCVFYGYSATGGDTESVIPVDPEAVRVGSPGKPVAGTIAPIVQGLKIASNGTILDNNETKTEQRNNTIPILSTSSIRTFLNKYYGYPLDVVDNILTGSSSADNIHGTDINSNQTSNVNADCPNSPAPEEIVRWALRIRNRNL